MSDLNFCPDCGAKIAPGDRFCGECGFDIHSLKHPEPDEKASASKPAHTAPLGEAGPPSAPQAMPAAPKPQPGGGQRRAAGNDEALGRKSAGNKNALIIMIALLTVVFLGGGGLYWLLSRGEEPRKEASSPAVTQKNGARPDETQPAAAAPATAKVDLTRASTYLSEPGLKCTFYVNYPDGTAGVVERTSGQAVPAEAVRVSEVETGVEQGEAYGYGFHYVERADGTYYILDQSPHEIFPVLKNNLSVGQSWNYQDEFGQVSWTVVDMGVDLNLGFAAFEDCLLVKEDNQAVQYQSITYYAPGRGIVLVIDPGGSTEYYKLTAMTHIDLAQAANTVIKWSPNYKNINDDRTQSY